MLFPNCFVTNSYEIFVAWCALCWLLCYYYYELWKFRIADGDGRGEKTVEKKSMFAKKLTII